MPASVTAGFIDVATYDHLEIAFYGGDDAVTFYVRTIVKSTWTTNVTTQLTTSSSTPPSQTSPLTATISRAGDYLLRMWLRVVVPEFKANARFVSTKVASGAPTSFVKVRWCANLGHNMIDHAELSFNDLITIRFDNYFMDFWAAMTVPAGKQAGYNSMIGNTQALTNPPFVLADTGSLATVDISSAVLTVPIPISHFMNTGVALPTAALPYNEMKLNLFFRPISSLMMMDSYNSNAFDCSANQPISGDLVNSTYLLGNSGAFAVQVMAEYAIVSNPERKKMGAALRDIPIKQMQNAPYSSQSQTSASSWGTISTDLRFAHAVQTLFFALQNTTNANEWSNYTTLPGYYVDQPNWYLNNSLVGSQTLAQGTGIGTSGITGPVGPFGSTGSFIWGSGGSFGLGVAGTSAGSVIGTNLWGTMATGGVSGSMVIPTFLGSQALGLALWPAPNLQFKPAPGFDPIGLFTLNYENTARHDKLEIDSLALVEPFYKGVSIASASGVAGVSGMVGAVGAPNAFGATGPAHTQQSGQIVGAPHFACMTGLHTYNYTRDMLAINGEGSTNYGKLTNVSSVLTTSAQAQTASFVDVNGQPFLTAYNVNGAVGGVGGRLVTSSLKYNVIFVGINLNLVRTSGGALGFPIL